MTKYHIYPTVVWPSG